MSLLNWARIPFQQEEHGCRAIITSLLDHHFLDSDELKRTQIYRETRIEIPQRKFYQPTHKSMQDVNAKIREEKA